MSLNAVMSNALSSLLTNAAALDVVSSNVSNVNTPNYAKRVVNEAAQAPGGQLSGVEIASIQRVADQFLTQQTLSASSASSSYSAQNDVLSQINALLGQVGDGTDLPSQLDKVFSALGSASLSPSAGTSQQAVLTALNNFASSVSSLSSSISGVQQQVDQQVVTDVGSANGYIQQIYTLNQQIATQIASGNSYTSLLDQRDQAVQSLSGLIGLSTTQTANGELMVSTTDGVNLVGTSTYGQLNYAGGNANGSYGPVVLQSLSGLTGQPIGNSQPLNQDISSGKIAGLLQMRDGTLTNLQQELGAFAQQTALAFNAQSNANVSFPAPASLTGRNTGLLSTDSLNFTGATTIAVTDPNGNLVSRIDVDFGAGTISVDGNPPASIGTTVGSFVTALNSALGANGSASFTNGVLNISATGGNGIAVQDNASNPTSRGGTAFSQFFGLNDIFQSAVPSISATGLSSTDASGFAAGGTMKLELQSPNGTAGPQASVTLTAGMTIGDIVTALNTAFGSAANFTLSSNGQLTMTPGPGYSGYSLNVLSDSTQRGGTGMSVSTLFGLGNEETADQAEGFSVTPSIANGQQALPFAEPQITPTTVAGGTVVASGDSSGLLALQKLSSTQLAFPAVGALNGQLNTLANYAGNFYQSVATMTQTTQANATASSGALTEAQTRQSQESGVNLDTELSNMILYQQAYSAGARAMQTAQQVYSTLMQIQ